MKKLAGRAWAALGEHPLTLLGLVLGLTFVLVVGLIEQQTRRQVRLIEQRVVVIERQQQARPQVLVCTSAEPDSFACRQLRRALEREAAP